MSPRFHDEIPSGVEAVLRPLRPAYYRLRERVGKAIFGRGAELHTEGTVKLEELGLAGPERSYYQPSRWSTLPRILAPRDVSKQDVFIDYGAGMGRVICQAAVRYPFKRVIGVELASELSAIARSNVELNKERLRCSNVELVTADALEYNPPSDITVAYFCNPFQGRTFEAVATKLLDAVVGPLRIIYFNPVEHEMLMATGRLRVVKRLRGWRPTSAWAGPLSAIMYELVTQ